MLLEKWTEEQVKQVLYDRQWTVTDEKPLPHGKQFVLADGTRVNWYTSGKVDVQGKVGNTRDEASIIFGASFSSYIPMPKPKIFVVYGHDSSATDLLKSIIEGFGLEPIILDQISGGGKTIIEQLENQMRDAVYACVLLTPDDEGYKSGGTDGMKHRARQNVLFEFGMAVGKLGREKVTTLYKRDPELPSDIHGLIYTPFDDEDVEEAKDKLKADLEKAGIEIRPQ